MIELSNDHLRIALSPGGQLTALEDRRRGITWEVQGDQGWHHHDDTIRVPYAEPEESPLRPLPAGEVEVQGQALRVIHPLPDGAVTATYTLESDHLAITVTIDSAAVAEVVLPGSLLPAGGGERLLL
ncbi:MAG: hypothetical protein ACYTGH_13615, partial [Planctomycetota bacterium]